MFSKFLTVQICFATIYTKRKWGVLMNFALNSMIIDAIIIFILLLMIVFGYFKGFVYRAYDLVATVVSLLFSLYASSPLSTIFNIYQVEGIGKFVGDIINRFIIFIILFIILKIILGLIGMIMKPILQKIIYTFSIFESLDHLLGAIVSFVESVIMVYLTLIFIITPLVPGGSDKIEETIVANKILELVPTVTDEMKLLTNGMDSFITVINDGINYESLDSKNIVVIASSLNAAYEHGLISNDDLESVVIKYYDEIDKIDSQIILNQNQYNELVELLSKVEDSNFDKTKILNKIIVSE